jgi:cell division protein FtsQ
MPEAMKKLKILIIWLGVSAYLVFALGFVSKRYDELIYTDIRVNIPDSLTNRFISTEEIRNLLTGDGDRLLGYPRHAVNTRKLENLLALEPFISNASVYRTIDGVLHARIIQRKPVLRVINLAGQSYYIDNEGIILPVSEKFTSRVLVANGHISEPFQIESNRSIFQQNATESRKNRVVYDLFELASLIGNSDLWSAQITQVYVNSKYEFELIPRVGAHIIYFGDATDAVTKFRKLEALYRDGLSDIGWNKYESINLKYQNQVVCTKR